MGLDRTDREEGLSAKGELPASEEDRPLLGGGIMDQCRTTGRREPITPGFKPHERGGTGWECAGGARGVGTVKAARIAGRDLWRCGAVEIGWLYSGNGVWH